MSLFVLDSDKQNEVIENMQRYTGIEIEIVEQGLGGGGVNMDDSDNFKGNMNKKFKYNNGGAKYAG